jgi:hypothetical protein
VGDRDAYGVKVTVVVSAIAPMSATTSTSPAVVDISAYAQGRV